MRRFVVLLSCIFVMVAGAGPAAATTGQHRVPPSAPTSLTVTPAANAAATVAWKAPVSTGSARVLVYKISYKADGQRFGNLAAAPAKARSVVIRKLTAGTTYSISVVAWSSAGPSPATTTKYTVPKPAASFIFVFDTTAASIVKIPTAGGPASTVAGGLTADIQFAVDKAGNTFIADPVAKSVFTVAVDQPIKTRIRSGLTDLRDVQLDAGGRVYVLTGSTVIRLAGPGSPEKVIGKSPTGFTADAMFVDGGGTVSILSKRDFDENLLTIPASGAPTSRSVGAMYEGSSYLGIIGDRVGTIYVNFASSGASGYRGLEQGSGRIPAAAQRHHPPGSVRRGDRTNRRVRTAPVAE